MKRYKRVLILTVILAVVCAATFVLTRYEQEQEQIRTSDAVILQIPSQSVRGLSWEYSGGGGLAFRKTEEGWRYQEDDAFPVSEEKVLDILRNFEEYGVTFVISEVTDYAQYGLDEPECVLRLETDEDSYTLKMGAFSKLDQQRYIDIGDGNVYLVREDPMDYVDANLSSMILHDDTPGFETVVDITFAGSENYTVVRREESPDTYAPEEDIYFAQREGQMIPLNTPSVKTFLNTVTSLELLTYATYNATEEALKSYGLDAPLLSATVNYTHTETDADGEETAVADSCTVHISEDPEERAASDAAVAAGDAATAVTKYVRIGDSQIVYILDDVDFGILREVSFDDLRHREVFWADFETVTGIDVELEGQTHTLTCRLTGEEDAQERSWYYGEAEAPQEEALDISGVEDALLALRADSFTEERPGQVEELRLRLRLEEPNFPLVEIVLYRYDGEHCLAAVDGEPVSLVPRGSVMDLVEAVQAIVLSR